MNTIIVRNRHSNENEAAGFDLARLSKAKESVDVCPNTLRAYNRAGLPFYRRGKAVFFSKAELDQFIRDPGAFKKGPAPVGARRSK
jgi:hypothetical protein